MTAIIRSAIHLVKEEREFLALLDIISIHLGKIEKIIPLMRNSLGVFENIAEMIQLLSRELNEIYDGRDSFLHAIQVILTLLQNKRRRTIERKLLHKIDDGIQAIQETRDLIKKDFYPDIRNISQRISSNPTRRDLAIFYNHLVRWKKILNRFNIIIDIRKTKRWSEKQENNLQNKLNRIHLSLQKAFAGFTEIESMAKKNVSIKEAAFYHVLRKHIQSPDHSSEESEVKDAEEKIFFVFDSLIAQNPSKDYLLVSVEKMRPMFYVISALLAVKQAKVMLGLPISERNGEEEKLESVGNLIELVSPGHWSRMIYSELEKIRKFYGEETVALEAA